MLYVYMIVHTEVDGSLGEVVLLMLYVYITVHTEVDGSLTIPTVLIYVLNFCISIIISIVTKKFFTSAYVTCSKKSISDGTRFPKNITL